MTTSLLFYSAWPAWAWRLSQPRPSRRHSFPSRPSWRRAFSRLSRPRRHGFGSLGRGRFDSLGSGCLGFGRRRRSFLSVELYPGNHFRGAARSLNLFQGGFGKQMSLHQDFSLQFARSQDLEAVFQPADHAQFQQFARIEGIAFETIQMAQIDDGELFAEDVGKSALGQAPVQRHLAAFKSTHPRVSGNGLGALGAAAGKFSAARSHALADTLVLVLLTLGRLELTEVHMVTRLFNRPC